MTEVSEELRSKIKKQIDFYFSDSNFRRDIFLKETTAANPNGYVPITVLLTFNRLKALTTDEKLIAECMKGSEVVEVSEDGKSIKRLAELPQTDDSMGRTVYAKGFPVDDSDVTIDSLTELFSKFGSKVLMVRMRKDINTKIFKGSCFIEMESEDAMKKVVSESHEGTEVTLKWKDTPLLCVMPYLEWRSRKDMKRKRGAGKSKSNEGDNENKNDGKDEELTFDKGLVAKVTGIPSDATVFEIKDFFKAIASVKFVDYVANGTEAFIRVADNEAMKKVEDSLKAGTTLRKNDDADKPAQNLEYTILTGDEEYAYWQKISAGSKEKNSRGGKKGGWKKRRKY